MTNNFKGIVLQPISRSKSPWKGFNQEKDNFLDYFQSSFKNEICNEFHVNHNTEEFSDYLLIPYFTDNKKCFGAYYIEYGSEVENNYYSYKYHINYSKSYNFINKIHKSEIMDESGFNNEDFEEINTIAQGNRVVYSKVDKVSENFKNYLLKLFEKETIED